MKLPFTKMQGCGNDYVYVDTTRGNFSIPDKSALAVSVSDRHFGIGSDGLIFINPSPIADFEMEMYNADGSRSQMCGNGIRCVAKYVYDEGLAPGETFTIESMGKIKYITVFPKGGKADTVRVDMGEPILEAAEIPVHSLLSPVIGEYMNILGKDYRITCVSMGNPHAVVFSECFLEQGSELQDFEIEKVGPLCERAAIFPMRTNTEFVQVVSRDYVKMRVWERGTGETLACGTGCCATLVACVLNGKTDRKITVEVLGGKLCVEWNEQDNHVYMTGPARTVFAGEIEI